MAQRGNVAAHWYGQGQAPPESLTSCHRVELHLMRYPAMHALYYTTPCHLRYASCDTLPCMHCTVLHHAISCMPHAISCSTLLTISLHMTRTLWYRPLDDCDKHCRNGWCQSRTILRRYSNTGTYIPSNRLRVCCMSPFPQD